MDKTYNALLIEDNENWVHYFNEVIEKSPKNCFKFDYASTAKEARMLLKEKNYELVLLDLILPDCKGENTLLALKEDVKTTPVIIITALVDEEVKKFCFANGVDDYLTKDEYNENTFFHITETAVSKAINKAKKELINVSDNLNSLKNTLTQILNGLS